MSIVVLLLGVLAVTAVAQPTTPKPADPSVSLPGPTTSLPEACQHNPLPYCFPSTTPGQPSTPTSNPCANIPPGQPRPPDCIPQPTTSAPAPTGPQQPGQPGGGPSNDCGITDIGACITEAIDGFFRGIVTAALNPLLDLLSRTLLTTPTPDSLPRIGELWNQSWEILLACYGILILIAGLLVMAYESVQTRTSIKEIAPRIVVGFLAGFLSLFLAGKAIDIANALAVGVMGGGVDANSAAGTLKNLITGSLNGGLFIIFIGLVLAGLLIALLVTYVVRVSLTVILIAGAPLMLMFHALPQTDGIARTWWKAFGGCLAIQVVQSLTLITAMRVFLAPGGFTPFGPTASGLVNLLVALALMYILFKIPFWILGSLRHGGRRSFLSGIARAYVMGKTMGLLGSRSRTGTSRATQRRTSSPHRSPSGQARPPRPRRTPVPKPTTPRQRRPPGGRPQPPQFLQPTPQIPTHHLATGAAASRPSMPRFQSTTTTPPASSNPPPTVPPGPPVFTAAGARRARAAAAPPRMRTAAVPAHLQFQATTPAPPVRPVRPAGPAPGPAFQPPTPAAGATGLRARAHTPAPVQFRAPTSTPHPAPAPPTPRARPPRAPRTGGD